MEFAMLYLKAVKRFTAFIKISRAFTPNLGI